MDRVAVVGAGLTGLTAALRLMQAGYRLTVFERYPEPGGLVRVLEIGGEPLECFYHHLFTTDTAYVDLARELGLAGEIEWLPSRMGIWSHGRLWDFGTPQSLLSFRPLPWKDKVRFALSTLALQRRTEVGGLDRITAREWLLRHQGEAAWRAIWHPLLVQKFGPMADQVAMVWLWRKIFLRGRSRSRTGMGERLGYMRGSFARLVRRLWSLLEAGGVELRPCDPVRRIEAADGGGLRLLSRSGDHRFRAVLAATSLEEYLEMARHLLPEEERERLGGARSTGALCTVLELDRSLTPYYWLNIADPGFPFGGLIEHTNYIPKERYGGRHVLYISNYLFRDDPLFSRPARDLLDRYLPALRTINPAFEPSWILDVHHFRAASAQPVVTPGYSRLIPGVRTPVAGLYLSCMAQIYPEDRGQNYAVAYGERAASTLAADLGNGSV